ncbi:MAG TPA: O-antigen ligase family protein, partial [Chloroflexota bacterium]|nr:O-antigen ligase family protein [Chloroflexota bacterium]
MPSSVLEAGWLVLAVAVPLTFSRFSYDAFELPKQLALFAILELTVFYAIAVWIAGGGLARLREWRRSGSSIRPDSSETIEQGAGSAGVSPAPSSERAGTPALQARIPWFLRHAPFIAAGAVALGWVLASVFSVAPEQSWWGLPPRWAGTRAQLYNVGLFLIAASVLTRQAQLTRLAVVTAVAGVITGAYSLLQSIKIDPFEWAGYVGSTQAADVSGRPIGTFGNPNFLAGYLVLSLFVTAGATLHIRHIGGRAALLVAFLVQATALVITQTRGAWVGTLVGAVVFGTLVAALSGRRWQRWLLGGCAAFLLVLALLRAAQPIAVPGSFLARATSIVQPTEFTAAVRLALWRSASVVWLERPLVGFGPDALGSVFQRTYGPELAAAEGGAAGLTQYDRSENAVLDTLLATGALGGLAMLAVGLVVARSVSLLTRRGGAAPLVAGATAALAAHLVAQQFNVEVVGASFLAWLLAGALAGLAVTANYFPSEDATSFDAAPGPAGVLTPEAPDLPHGNVRTSLPRAAAAALVVLLTSPLMIWWDLQPLRAGMAYEIGLQLERANRPAEAVPHLRLATTLWPHYYLYWAEQAYAHRAAARATAVAGPERERHQRLALAAVDRALTVNGAL